MLRTLVFLVAAGSLLSGRAMGQVSEFKPPRITVMGEGKVMITPDLAEINIGVVTENEKARAALTANNEAMQELITSIKAFGVEAKDIQTSQFSVSPRFDRDPRRASRINGYTVSNQLHVKLRNIAKLGEVLDKVVTSGANRVQGVSFSVAKPSDLQDQARAKALEEAKRIGTLMAQLSGKKLGDPLNIEIQSGFEPMPMQMGRAFAMDEAGGTVPVEAGQHTIVARVSATFELK